MLFNLRHHNGNASVKWEPKMIKVFISSRHIWSLFKRAHKWVTFRPYRQNDVCESLVNFALFFIWFHGIGYFTWGRSVCAAAVCLTYNLSSHKCVRFYANQASNQSSLRITISSFNQPALTCWLKIKLELWRGWRAIDLVHYWWPFFLPHPSPYAL